MAMVTFGGAYAVLAYVAQQAVEHYGWLKPGEMLDGLGMAETTPGPLIMVLQFVGFMAAFRDPGGLSPMLAGTLGGLLATWVTFTPCFLWIFLGAPFVEKLRGNKALSAALSAITAAVVGVVLEPRHLVCDPHDISSDDAGARFSPVLRRADTRPASTCGRCLLSLAAAIAIFRFKVGMIPTLAACCLAGSACTWWGRSREALRHPFVAVPLSCGVTDVARAETITFERDVVGIAPGDFDSWGTGDAGPGQWAVVSDDSVRGGHALEQYRDERTDRARSAGDL